MLEYKMRMINAGLASEDDFDRSGCLKSRITFKALVLPWEISKRTREYVSKEGQVLQKVYWLLRDRYGASFSTRSEQMVKAFEECEREGALCEISGTIKIVRGSTYLNAETCHRFMISDYGDEKADEMENENFNPQEDQET